MPPPTQSPTTPDCCRASALLASAVAVDVGRAAVTLPLRHGRSGGVDVWFVVTDSSNATDAAERGVNFAPRLADIEAVCPDCVAHVRSFGGELIFNGARTARGQDPAPQGLRYAALDGGLALPATAADAPALRASMNVFGSFPTGPDAESYTPLWSANVGMWTAGAVAAREVTRLTSPREFTNAAARGLLTAPDGAPFGPVGVAVNCPVVAYLESAPVTSAAPASRPAAAADRPRWRAGRRQCCPR
jgi:hypothetical protein